MADQPISAVEPQDGKAPRHRSPNYPSIGLRNAVTKAEALYKGGAINPLQKISILKQLGFDKMHGEAGRVLSALKSFRLIEETDDRIKLSQSGLDIVVRPASDPRRIDAIHKAAIAPPIYKDLLERVWRYTPSGCGIKV